MTLVAREELVAESLRKQILPGDRLLLRYIGGNGYQEKIMLYPCSQDARGVAASWFTWDSDGRRILESTCDWEDA